MPSPSRLFWAIGIDGDSVFDTLFPFFLLVGPNHAYQYSSQPQDARGRRKHSLTDAIGFSPLVLQTCLHQSTGLRVRRSDLIRLMIFQGDRRRLAPVRTIVWRVLPPELLDRLHCHASSYPRVSCTPTGPRDNLE